MKSLCGSLPCRGEGPVYLNEAMRHGRVGLPEGVIEESSNKIWSTKGNGKPLQYTSCVQAGNGKSKHRYFRNQ